MHFPHYFPLLLYVLAGLTAVLGSPVNPQYRSSWQEQGQQAYNAPTSPRPLVLWHGLGQSPRRRRLLCPYVRG